MSYFGYRRRLFYKSFLGALIVVLIILIVLSGTLLSTRLFNYIKLDSREVILENNLEQEFELFQIRYENELGEITVCSSDNTNVIAPGTKMECLIRLRNKGEDTLKYEFIPKVQITDDKKIPISIRVRDYNNNYIIGSEKQWIPMEQLSAVAPAKTLDKDTSIEYIFEWKWAYEAGNDTQDTLLGSSSAMQDLNLSLSFTVHAENSIPFDAYFNITETGLGGILLSATVLLLGIIALISLVILLFKKLRGY